MAKRTSLADFHKDNGAIFFERDGWLLPTHFGNPAVEYTAVRSTCGFIDLSHRGLLQFSGPDRLSFLQGMLSNDLKLLKPFEGQSATLLTQQGKVIADVRVLCSLNSFYLDFWENRKSPVIEHLNRYLVADEVEIADRSEEYATLSVQGPQSKALLQKLFRTNELPAKLLHHAMVELDGIAICIVHASHTGEPGFDLIAPKGDLKNLAARLTESGKPIAAAWVGEDAHNVLRVEAGIPRYGVDFSDDNLLLEVGIENSYSYTKGCYLGQEVVERIRSRGHVNKKLTGLLLEGLDPANSGDAVQADGKDVGRITSSVSSPRLKRSIALAYLNKEYWTPGTALSIVRNGATTSAVVTGLPFVSSS
jgi:folate-binding protein YgfZ